MSIADALVMLVHVAGLALVDVRLPARVNPPMSRPAGRWVAIGVDDTASAPQREAVATSAPGPLRIVAEHSPAS